MSLLDSLKGKNITIIGAGVSGTGLARFASRLGASVFVSENKMISEETKNIFHHNGVSWEEGHTAKACETDLVVLSSGIPPFAPVVRKAVKNGIFVMGELDFLAPYLQGVLIGVTGSNGKSTTTSLVGHMLKNIGYSVAIVGNIGNSLAEAALRPWDYLVMELSSFQLHWNTSLSCQISIVTNLAPDHIDWHGSYEEYVGAKTKILVSRKENGFTIVQERDRDLLFKNIPHDGVAIFRWGDDSPGMNDLEIVADEKRRSVFFRSQGNEEKLFAFDSLPLLGKHNVENGAMAAGALRLLSIEGEYGSFFKGFKGLPHRCEVVAKINGVLFIDDSKGTNVASTSTALGSISGQKVVILGGRGKGEDYAPLAVAVRKETCAAVVMGEERDKIVSVLRAQGVLRIVEASDMEDAVGKAVREVPENGVVLLSPACTSWDMYPNYKKRGEHFQNIVLKLER